MRAAIARSPRLSCSLICVANGHGECNFFLPQIVQGRYGYLANAADRSPSPRRHEEEFELGASTPSCIMCALLLDVLDAELKV